MAPTYGEYEPVIGLEVHAQLLTRTKAFCGCACSFGDPPNTHACPVCLGLPGALPVLNGEAVRLAMRASLALGCTIQPRSVFARKNYFYPDLPKGYQISQYELPLALDGALELEADLGPRRAGILRVHMEEDAGKNLHGLGDDSVVDLNRAGTPLIEIVGNPDLRSASEAAEYLRRLREILMFLGVNDGNLEQGSFRCDANVSVRGVGEARLGTRTELKNINSFRFVEGAIDVEIRRQIALLGRGERVRQQTRGYNADKRETYLLRDKENESGYRYFPEPDLPPLVIEEALVDAVRGALPTSPAARRAHMVDELGLTPYAAGVLTSHPQIAAFFERTVSLYSDAVKAANFIQSEVLRDVRTTGLTAEVPVSPAQIAELLRLVDEGSISGKQAKEVYAAMQGTDALPASIVAARGMRVLSDEGALEELARTLVAASPKQAAAYRGGKANLLGFFVGQMMKQTDGSADPAAVNAVLKRVLDAGEAATGAASRTMGAPAAGLPSSGSSSGVRPADPGIMADPGVVDRAAETQSRPVPPETQSRPSPPETLLGTGPGLAPDVASPMAHSVPPPPMSAPAPSARDHTTLTSALGMPAAPVAAPQGSRGDFVPYEAFLRLDLRAAKIVSALPVPRHDKLLALAVDLGGELGQRRIIAALAPSYAAEELVGRRVIVACNLEPRDFGGGLVSHGAILTAGPPDGLTLAVLSEDLPPGTRVK